jgi:hypothetical protein
MILSLVTLKRWCHCRIAPDSLYHFLFCPVGDTVTALGNREMVSGYQDFYMAYTITHPSGYRPPLCLKFHQTLAFSR